ncbi:MAG: hypothetical protein ACLQIB_23160 [Isosphaeraceae bacterium]
MMAQLEITPPQQDRPHRQRSDIASANLVLVASEPAQDRGTDVSGSGTSQPTQIRKAMVGRGGLVYTRIAALDVAGSATWSRRRGRATGVSPGFMEPIGRAQSGRALDLPGDLPGILRLLDQETGFAGDRQGIAAAIVALRAADAVIAGPLAAADANSPGLLPHLADLATRAYRALRPPRELIIHPGFAQVARRFHFIQMSRQEARALGTGASDLGILAQRLRRLQGDPGEFAITGFDNHGLLWADNAWWEIEPIAGADAQEPVATAVFCVAWVVARRFRGAGAAPALAYSHAVASEAVKQAAARAKTAEPR